MNVREDKIVLLLHRGGHLELRLRSRPPVLGVVGDGLVDVFDSAVLVNTQAGSVIHRQVGTAIWNYKLTILNGLTFLLQAPIVALTYFILLPRHAE